MRRARCSASVLGSFAIVRSLSGLKSGEAFFGWMYTIAGRAAVEAEKKRRRQSFEALPDQGVFEERDGVIDLRTAIARLTLAQRSTIVLYYYAGLSSAEIGQVLNVPSATVRFHLMLGRRALRRALSDSVSGQEACEHA